jgi:hypothetical protein
MVAKHNRLVPFHYLHCFLQFFPAAGRLCVAVQHGVTVWAYRNHVGLWIYDALTSYSNILNMVHMNKT